MSGIWRSVSVDGYDASVADTGNAFAYFDNLIGDDDRARARQQRIQRERQEKEQKATREEDASTLHAFAFEALSEMFEQEFARLKREFDEAYERYEELYQQRRQEAEDNLRAVDREIESARKPIDHIYESGIHLSDGRRAYRSEVDGQFYSFDDELLDEDLQEEALAKYKQRDPESLFSHEDKIRAIERFETLQDIRDDIVEYIEDIDQKHEEAQRLKQDMDNLERRYEAGEISRSEYSQTLEDMRGNIEALESHEQYLEETPPPELDSETAASYDEELNEDWQTFLNEGSSEPSSVEQEVTADKLTDNPIKASVFLAEDFNRSADIVRPAPKQPTPTPPPQEAEPVSPLTPS